MSNKLEQVTTTNPYGKTAECGMFTIDTPTAAFMLSDIAMSGQTYTFSCWIKSDVDSGITVNGMTIPSTTSWKAHAVTFTAVDKNVPILFDKAGTYYIYHPQLEQGNKPSDWAPAPEDADDITGDLLDTMIKQKSELIQTCEELILSAGEKYVETGEYEEYKSSVVSEFSVTNDSITARFETATEQTTKVDGSLQTLKNSISKHIEFSSDNAITIGGSSGIILTVDNDNGIIFSKIVSQTGTKLEDVSVKSSKLEYQLSTGNVTAPTGDWLSTIPVIPSGYHLWIRRTIAYEDNSTFAVYSVAFGSWDGNDFYTGNIVVRLNERAQFGNFAFVPRSDGSLSFLKVGG